MLFLLVILAVAVALSGLFVFYWARYPKPDERRSFGRPKPRGLFDDRNAQETGSDASAHRRVLLERAGSGDLAALEEAQDTADSALYSEVLDALIEAGGAGSEKFRELVSFISKSKDLRANPRLAARAIEQFKEAPSVRLATETLHIAALSDDAAMYHSAVDTALEAWKLGRLERITGADLKKLVESQFWVLAQPVRSSGAGFKLKRRLAGIRRELAPANASR
jgi:hypothetical protein